MTEPPPQAAGIGSMEAAPPSSRRAILGLLIWAVAATLLGRSFTAVAPGQQDAQLFAYIGAKWLHGSVPYLDIWDNKPPGIFLVTALASVLMPKSFLILALFEGVVIFGCITTVHGMMRRIGAPPMVVFLATAACATMANLRYYNEGGTLTEIYTLLPASLSIFVFLPNLRRLRRSSLVWAGFWAGVSASFKLIGIAPLLAELAFLIVGCLLRHYRVRAVILAGAMALTGFLLAWLPWLAYFHRKHCALDLIDASFLSPFLYGAESQSHLYHLPFAVCERLAPVAGLATAAAAALAVLVPATFRAIRTSRPAPTITPLAWKDGPPTLLALWCSFDFLGALAGGRFYQHYFLAMAASLSATAAVGYWLVVERRLAAGETRERVRVFTVAVMGASALFAQIGDVRSLRVAVHTKPQPDFAVDYLRAHKVAGTTLFSWIYTPHIFFETEFASPHRLTSSHYLIDSPHVRRIFAEDLMQTLERAPPTFLVDADHHTDAGTDIPRVLAPIYERFRRLVDRRYELVKLGGGLNLYEKRP